MSKNYIKLNYNPDCNIIDMTTLAKQDPKICLEITPQLRDENKFTKGSILQAAVGICNSRMQEKPVIVILKSIQQCWEFHKKLSPAKAYVFDTKEGETSTSLSILKEIKILKGQPYPVVITTALASLGFNFFEKAHVILTQEPANYTEYT